MRTWPDRVREALLAQLPEEQALDLLHRYGEHFSAAYQEECDGARVAPTSRSSRGSRKRRRSRDHARAVGGRAASDCGSRPSSATKPIPLYVALPILENMGFKVHQRARLSGSGRRRSALDSGLRSRGNDEDGTRPGAVDARFKQCFALVLHGDAENDGFNGFVASAGFDWREATLLRAFCKYILQTRIGYSQAYMQAVLARYPAYCRALVDKFEASVRRRSASDERASRLAASENALKRELDRA